MSEVTRVMVALNQFLGRIVAEISTEVVAELVATTPVDTGWAQSNWITTLGSARTDPVGTYAAALAGSVSYAAQKLGLALVAPGAYNIKKGPVYITNNVPYIGLLNTGSSAQAPDMFVQIAIAAAITRVVRGSP